MHLRRLLRRPSTSSPLDNNAKSMANTSQAPDLEGIIYHEMHGDQDSQSRHSAGQGHSAKSHHRSASLHSRRYGDNRPTIGDIQTIHGGLGSGGCSSSSQKRHAREANGRVKEEVYNLSAPLTEAHQPITFTNDALRGLHLSHDNALMKIGRNRLHPFHTALVEFKGSSTNPLGWIKLLLTLGVEPHQTTVWQDFIVVDYPSPYNAILGCLTLGKIKAITSTYHLMMKFPTSIGIGKIGLHSPDVEKTSFFLKTSFLVEECKGDVSEIGQQDVQGDDRENNGGLTIKAQALADFIDDYTYDVVPKPEITLPERDYLINNIRMVAYLDEVKGMSMKIREFKIRQIHMQYNKKADALANLALAFNFISNRSKPLEFLPNPSIDFARTIFQTIVDPTWMDDIIAYIKDEKLPLDKLQAQQIQYRSNRFCLI
ncbi:hypothetical protein Acr_04g0000050 [Actinidia rufa]|uniref:Uncharacterized protein n=1 Tax=Actinidia rufa TaxID=165716 RepID=A0A7J0EI02_9ERIC|nr:hypothetical protein Acr_04g0000050 [Actinidia rufa]